MVNDHRSRAALTLGESFAPVRPEIYGENILVMMPHLLLTITSPLALRTWLRAWTIAERYAQRVWATGTPGAPLRQDTESNQLSVSLRLSGRVGAPAIRATSPIGDLDRRGHLALTIDPLRIDIRHGSAWQPTWDTMRAAYRAGESIWDLPDLDAITPRWDRWWREQVASQRHNL